MEKREIEVYEFYELDEQTQEKILNKFRDDPYRYAWDSENRDTLNAFEKVFPIKIKYWSYGGRGEGVNFEMTCDDEIENMTGLRLRTYLINNFYDDIFKRKLYWKNFTKKRASKLFRENSCVLTGYCMDDNILDPVYKFIKKPNGDNFYDLMNDCLQGWVYSCSRDQEYAYSDESIKEDIEANDYRFDANGRIM